MKNRKLLILPLVASLGMLAAGCGGGSAKLTSDDVAKVGGVVITRAQFAALMKQAQASYQAQGTTFPKQTSTQYQQLKNQAVQFLVQNAEFQQEADDLGVKVDQKQVDERMKQLVKTYYGGSQKKFEAALKKQHIERATVEDRIRNQVLQQELYDKVTSKVKVSPAEIQTRYNQQYKETRDVRHILVKSKALAYKLDKELRANGGKNFAELAKKYSTDTTSAAHGGDLGSISKGQTVFQFDTTAFTLGTKTVSTPIHTQYGWHIIQPMSEIKPPTPFSQVQETLKQGLLAEKKQQAMTSWVEGLSKKFHPQYAIGFGPPSSGTQTTTTGG